MKLPEDMPFVILDRNMYGTQESSRLTEDFIEWLVRDCAKVCRDNAERAEKSGARSIAQAHRTDAADLEARYSLELKDGSHD